MSPGNKRKGFPVFLPGLLPIYISTQECLPGLGQMAQAFLYTRQRNTLQACLPVCKEGFSPAA